MKRLLLGMILTLSVLVGIEAHSTRKALNRIDGTFVAMMETDSALMDADKDHSEAILKLDENMVYAVKLIGRELDKLKHPDYSGVLHALENTVVVLIGENGHGSGVILRDGYVLTAGHCADGVKPTVKTADGELYGVADVYVSPEYDIAVLKVPGITGGIELAHNVELFDPVAVIGTPWDRGLEGSITFGLVTCLDRDWFVWAETYQVSADASPGNSGGPVVNMQGQLIGILVGGPDPGSSVSICESLMNIVNTLIECDI